MLTKTQPDEIHDYLHDASNIGGGHAVRVVFPESADEVASILVEATRDKVPVTVAGAGTGLVGGRVPYGGIVLATDRLNQIKNFKKDASGSWAITEAGVLLTEFQKAVSTQKLFYPPDPTEGSCFMGGTVATNASGPCTFKYGPTRRFVRRLKMALTTGDVLELGRDEVFADPDRRVRLPLSSGNNIDALLPTYEMPHTRKHASGYFVAPGMDLLDLFIGSEGTLGVITEVEVSLLPEPERVLGAVAFFSAENDILEFVKEGRELSLQTRRANTPNTIDARALEYFDCESLKFLRGKYNQIPQSSEGAVFFEQETTAETEDQVMSAWLELLDKHNALIDDSWFATTESDRRRMREFRHALPVLVNEWLAHHKQRKVSTDMAVPDVEFPAMLNYYKSKLRESKLQYVIFGHIGDNHVHVNILPTDDTEAERAREIYRNFVTRAISVGGTVSAEHGIGKLKREYLRMLFGDEHLKEMALLKRAFDPACILGRGNLFPEEYLKSQI